jgi:hypothetical protein
VNKTNTELAPTLHRQTDLAWFFLYVVYLATIHIHMHDPRPSSWTNHHSLFFTYTNKTVPRRSRRWESREMRPTSFIIHVIHSVKQLIYTPNNGMVYICLLHTELQIIYISFNLNATLAYPWLDWHRVSMQAWRWQRIGAAGCAGGVVYLMSREARIYTPSVHFYLLFLLSDKSNEFNFDQIYRRQY